MYIIITIHQSDSQCGIIMCISSCTGQMIDLCVLIMLLLLVSSPYSIEIASID
jgi:hypothetical protein